MTREVLGAELFDGVDAIARATMIDALLRMKNNLTAEPTPIAVGE
jgi:hypothetical protein